MKRKSDRSFIEIDVFALDYENAVQADHYKEQADLLAEGKFELDCAEAEFDIVKAELAFAIRRRPKAHGIHGRMSNQMIDHAMILTEEYQESLKTVHVAKRNVARLMSATKALDHKKQSLENLTYLQGQGYFAAPSMPKGKIGDNVREIRKKAVRRPIEKKGDHDDD